MSANISNRNNDKHRKQTQRRPRRGRLALALALALLAPAAWGGVVTPPTPQPVPACPLCLPEIGTVTSGAATSNLDLSGVMNPGPTGMDTLIITQTTNSAIIEWNTFNVASGFAVYFDQPSATSVTLNRVTGGNPSFIQGTINATGSVFLVNRAGILFGAGSSVNVGGLVASTMDITDANFNAGVGSGHYIFNAVAGFPGAPVVNQGAITADAGGTIALLAARIENQPGATLTAPEGSVVFGAASGVNLDFYNDGLTTVTLTGNGLDLDFYCSTSPVPTSSCLGGIESQGNIAAVGGHVEMRTQTRDGNPQPIGTGLFTEPSNGGRIWIGGRIDARASATDVGSIILDAGQGNVDIGGVAGQTAWINVNSTAAGQDAGTILVHGNQIFTYLCVGPGGVCAGNDSLGWLDATAYGAGGNGGQITIDATSLFYHTGVIQAAAVSGAGGTIQVNAGDAQIYNWITAEGLGGNGGTIGITAPSILLHRGQLPWLGGPDILYSQAVLSAYGSTNGGTVNLTGGLDVVDLGNVTPADPEYASVINVRGMNGNGGTVYWFGDSLNIGSTWFANANGTQDGGTVFFDALTDDIAVAARMEANGGRDGGHISINGGYIDLTDATMYANGSRDGGTIYVQGDYVTMGDGIMEARGGVVPSVPTDPHLGNGGTINIYGSYTAYLYGTFDVSGSVDGGLIGINAQYALSVDGTFLADGGASPLATDNHIGNGGHIYVLGEQTVDVAGSFSADAGVQASPDPQAPTYGGRIHIGGQRVNLDGVFTTTGNMGWLETSAYDYLYINPTTDVAAPNWFISGSDVWITTASGASAFTQGAVIQDQTLITALNHGTFISMNADNALYSPTGSGAVLIDSGVSIMSSGYGLLQLRALNGISGSNFFVNTGGVYLDAGGSSIQLDDFTMDAGTVEMNGGSISLTAAHINTFGGGFSATANSGGITLYSTWIDEAGGGDITLDASGSSYGIDAQWAYLDTGVGGGIVFNASNSAPGISISNSEFGGAGNTGAITLLADNSNSGIAIDNSTIASGASMLIQANAGGGIDIHDSTISADGDYLHIYATGGTGGIVLDSNTFANPAGSLVVDASGSDNGIYIYGVSSFSSHGDITLNADDSVNGGIVIYGASISIAGNGDATLSAQRSALGLLLDGSQLTSSGGGISLTADGKVSGLGRSIEVRNSTIDSQGGDVWMASGTAGHGIAINDSSIESGGGAMTLYANDTDYGIYILGLSMLDSAGGDIAMMAEGSAGGIAVSNSSVYSGSGSVTLSASGNSTDRGISIAGGAQIDSGGGAITLTADGTMYGVTIGDSAIYSGGGDIEVYADNSGYGLSIYSSTVESDGGDITLHAVDSGSGVQIYYLSQISSGSGNIDIYGTTTTGAKGVEVYYSSINSTSGDITIHGEGVLWGVDLWYADINTTTGDFNANGTSSGSNGIGVRVMNTNLVTVGGDVGILGAGNGVSSMDGVLINNGSSITTNSGNIEIAGQGGSGAGVAMDAGSSVNAGSGTVVIRASNNGSSDAIRLAGIISSATAVNLRPFDETDTIYLGSGNGFVLDNSDLASISAPWLVIGSDQQQGAIQVLGAIAWGGNLSLQNQGSGAGIHIGAGIDVSGHTLGLFTGGSITQSSLGTIQAESLLAMATGDVLLNDAQNDVTGNTLAGSAGGQFLYLDANGLSIGTVSAYGFNAGTGTLGSMGSSGISATDILVQTLTGDLTLNGNVQGSNVDLVAAGVFLNPGGATITASNGWRVWASTWVGEDRGGLLGSGPLPNLYNCTYGGSCGVTVGSGNHFIYTQQPFLTVSVDDATREYGEADPAFTYSISGLIFADDDPANVFSALLSSGTSASSNVGTYAINGSFSSLAGYGFTMAPGGFLTITPAMLLFTADPLTWYMGMPFPVMTGTVTGFKNGETLAQVFPNGVDWEAMTGSPGDQSLMPGYYPIFGFGNAQNYVIVQATSNQTALYLLPPPESSSRPLDFISDPEETFVYESNFESVAMCPLTLSADEQELAGGDPLGNEWSKVRKRLNLVNCFSNDRRGGCGSF